MVSDMDTAEALIRSMQPGQYRRVLVLVTGASEDDRDATIQHARQRLHSSGTPLEVFAPPGLRADDSGDAVSALATYILETRPASMGREAFALDLLLQRGWSGLGMAYGVVMSHREEVRCLDPDGGMPYQPRVRPGLVNKLSQRTQPTGVAAAEQLVGSSTAMKSLREQLDRFAPLPFPILLEGETGVGKELCAQFVHEASGRKGRMVAVNGALLDPNRAEDELSGHEKDAFTNAKSKRLGRIREAEGGTFFLDELHAVPMAIQPMLLRAFNRAIDGELEVVPLGQEKEIKVDVRLVTAIQPGAITFENFREDLLYRVMGLHVLIPPLRDRGDDVVEIAERVLQTLSERHHRGPRSVSADAREVLRGYAWPGNVRQLHVVMRQAWVDNQQHPALSADRLRPYMPKELIGRRRDAEASRTRGESIDLRGEVQALADDRIKAAIKQNPRSENRATRALGFETGQSMKRYLAKTKRDATEGRSRPK